MWLTLYVCRIRRNITPLLNLNLLQNLLNIFIENGLQVNMVQKKNFKRLESVFSGRKRT